jgi:hypothetical protein
MFTPLSAAHGAVHLTLMERQDPVRVGHVLTVDILMMNDLATSQDVATLDVVLAWDPNELQLLGVGADGAPWLTSGFLNDPDGLNDTFTDGDAFFNAIASPSAPVVIPAQATILARSLEFEALRPTALSEIAILAQAGQFAETRVFEPEPPQSNVLGSFSSTQVEIVCSLCIGDIDGSGAVDLDDLTLLLQDFGSGGAPGQVRGDIDCNGSVDLDDLTLLLQNFDVVCAP